MEKEDFLLMRYTFSALISPKIWNRQRLLWKEEWLNISFFLTQKRHQEVNPNENVVR